MRGGTAVGSLVFVSAYKMSYLIIILNFNHINVISDVYLRIAAFKLHLSQLELGCCSN